MFCRLSSWSRRAYRYLYSPDHFRDEVMSNKIVRLFLSISFQILLISEHANRPRFRAIHLILVHLQLFSDHHSQSSFALDFVRAWGCKNARSQILKLPLDCDPRNGYHLSLYRSPSLRSRQRDCFTFVRLRNVLHNRRRGVSPLTRHWQSQTIPCLRTLRSSSAFLYVHCKSRHHSVSLGHRSQTPSHK